MFFLSFSYIEIEMRDKMKKIIPFTKTIKFKTMIAEITDIETKHNLEVKEGNTIEGDILLDGKYKMHEASQIEEEFHYNLPFTIEVDNKYDISNCTITIDDFYFEIINEEDLKINIELEIGNVEEKPLPKEDISLDEEDIRKTVEKIPIEIEEKKEKIEIEPLEKEESIDELEITDVSDTISGEDGFPALPDKSDLEQEIEAKLTQEISKNKEIYDQEVKTYQQASTYTSSAATTTSTQQEEEINLSTVTKKDRPKEESKMSSIFNAIASSDETFVTYHVYIVRENDTVDSIIEKYKTTRDDLVAYNDLENIKQRMTSTYHLKKDQGVRSFYDIVIHNKDKEPIGFLAVQYLTENKVNFNYEQKNEILKLKFFIEENLEKMTETSKRREGK